MGRAVTFFGAADIPHCSGMVRFGKSDNVKVGGLGVSRQGDINTPHLLPGFPCPAHAAPIAIGSLKVKVNGRIKAAIMKYFVFLMFILPFCYLY